MHAIQDRFGDSQATQAGDAWDLHQLLTPHNQTGAIADALRDAPGVLAAAELQAADTVLVAGATRTRPWLRTIGGVQATVGVDEIRALGQQQLEGLSRCPPTGPGGRPWTAPNAGDSAERVATSLAASCAFVISARNLHPV